MWGIESLDLYVLKRTETSLHQHGVSQLDLNTKIDTQDYPSAGHDKLEHKSESTIQICDHISILNTASVLSTAPIQRRATTIVGKEKHL